MAHTLSAAERKQLALRAIDGGELEGLRTALAAGLRLNQKLNGAGQTALSYAVMRNQHGLIRHLLSLGADPNVLTASKLNALHMAEEVEVARWLLAAGADPHQRSRRGEAISHYAITFGRHAVSRFYNTLLDRARTAAELALVPPMPLERFWPLLEKSARKGGGDDSWQARELFMVMRYWPLSDTIAFERAFQLQDQRCDTSSMWAAAYIIRNGCSDDAFLDFRSWLVSLGRAGLTRALRDPDSLVRPWRKRVRYENYTAYDVPTLRDVARQAYLAGSGKDDFSDILRLAGLQDGEARPAGYPLDWSPDDPAALQARFPKLWRAFVSHA